MGTPLSRRRVLVAFAAGAGALGGAGLLSACTGSPAPVTPISTVPTAPDPLLAVLDERVRLIADYDAAGLQHPELLARLLPLRKQTEEQVAALRLALALPRPSPTATGSGTSTAAPTTTAVPVDPVDPAVTLAAVRTAVRASGSTAAALCETTTAQRAPLVGSLAAAAACHELMLR